MTVTVVIPTIPPRAQLLSRAIYSVSRQTFSPSMISISQDLVGIGAPKNRQRALEAVRTEWTAFLDDDDEFLPEHLEVLMTAAIEENADYVFSYYKIRQVNGTITDEDFVLGKFGVPFDPEQPHQTTVTTLVRTELAQSARMDNTPRGMIDGQRAGEDFQFTLRCLELGAHIVHVPQKTWIWQHHDSRTDGLGNTSGRPWNRPQEWS